MCKAVWSAVTVDACWFGWMAGVVLVLLASNRGEHSDFVCVHVSSVAGCLCLHLATAPSPTPQHHARDAIENRFGASYNRTNTPMFASKIRTKVLLHSPVPLHVWPRVRSIESTGNEHDLLPVLHTRMPDFLSSVSQTHRGASVRKTCKSLPLSAPGKREMGSL